MTNDRDLDQKVRTWLDEPPPGPPDRNAVYARVMDRLPETRQGRHWRRFQWNPFAAGATRSAGADGPRPQGRSRTMFTPVRVIAAAAILALGGSFAFIGPNLGPGDDALPPGAAAPEDEPIAATYVTGTMPSFQTVSQGSMSSGDVRISFRDAVEEHDIQWSDPRLPSSMRLTSNFDVHPLLTDELTAVISLMQSVVLEDADDRGAWSGTIYGLLEVTTEPETYPRTTLMILEGEGGYEGLSAMFRAIYDEPPRIDQATDWEGYIFEGGLTPVPEAPAPSVE